MPRAVVAKAIGVYRDVLKLVNLPSIAEIPKGLLHIRVSCSGLGFPDLLQVQGKYQNKAEPPFVPVIYLCGWVTAVGPDVEAFKVGDRIVGNASAGADGKMRGGLAEEALVAAGTAVLVPDFMSDEVALAMHENYWDVHHAVAVCGQVGPKDTLLVLGASGACGLAAIDLGRALGARVVACASSPAKLAACRAAGAATTIDYGPNNDADVFVNALKASGEYGNVTRVFDPVGGRYAEAAFRAMARGGLYVVFGFAAGGTEPKSAFPSFPINLLLMKGQTVMGSMGSSRGEKIQEMFAMVQSGRLKPFVAERSYSLEDFMQAFEDVASRRAVGKVLVYAQGTAPAKL